MRRAPLPASSMPNEVPLLQSLLLALHCSRPLSGQITTFARIYRGWNCCAPRRARSTAYRAGTACPRSEVVWLQRIGKLLRAVEDGNDIDAIDVDSIDQAIRVNDELAQIFVIVFGHDAPRARMVDQLLDATCELVDRLCRVERRVARDVLVDAIEVRLSLVGPNDVHYSGRP